MKEPTPQQHRRPRASHAQAPGDLPLTVYGLPIRIRGRVWEIPVAERPGDGTISLNWSVLENLAEQARWTETAVHTIEDYLRWRLPRKAAATVFNDFQMFVRLATWWNGYTRPPELTPLPAAFDWTYLLAWDASEFMRSNPTKNNGGNDFSRLRTFYRWGTAALREGFRHDLLDVLGTERAAGNPKGVAVRHRIPNEGPLTADERTLIIRAIKNKDGRPEDRAVVMLLLERGTNPFALRLLRNKHLQRHDTKVGTFYQVLMPRIKKREYGADGERPTQAFGISDELGQLLESLRSGGPDDPLLHWITTQYAAGGARDTVHRWVKDAQLLQPGTDRPMRLTARRFRYGLATYAHAKGASLHELAVLLDHTDTQNVQVYAQTSPSIADEAAKATDDAFRPLIQRFLGIVTDSLEENAIPDQPIDVIPGVITHLPEFTLDLGAIGRCGIDLRKERPCSLLPPITCYTCGRFVALASAPHQQVLETFEHYVAENPAQLDDVVLSQLDETVQAIRDLIRAIEQRRIGAA